MAEKLNVKTYSVRSLFEFEEVYDYYKHKIPLALRLNDEPVYLNMNKSIRMLIVGRPGAGKSWIMRGVMSRFYKAGGWPAVLPDVKPEYYTSARPLQENFRKFLLPLEKAEGQAVKTYRPAFLAKMTGMQRKQFETCQFSLADINVYDLYTLLDIENLNEEKRLGIESAFDKAVEGGEATMNALRRRILSDTQIKTQTAKSLAALLRHLQHMGVLGEQYAPVDFSWDMREGVMPCLDLSGSERAGKFKNYQSAYVGIIIRKILSAKKAGEIPRKAHPLIINDETTRFCGKNDNSTSAREILEALEMGRSERLSMIFSAQDHDRIAEPIFKECNYILIPQGIPLDDAKTIIKQAAPYEYDDPYRFSKDTADLVGSLSRHRDGTRDWLLIDRDRSDNYVVRPLAPLSFHKEE